MSKPNINLKKSKRNSSTSENISSETSDRSARENIIRKSIQKPKQNQNIDTIGKSKQLSKKLKTTRTRTTQNTSMKPNTGPRICGNGKAMPSLAELEQMFADSDDDTPSNSTISEKYKTPVENNSGDKPKLNLSPSTLKVISDKMMDLITHLPDPSILINENQPSIPVVPPKKRKKPDEPYIVGCKDRPQIIKKSEVVIGKGEEDYGVDYNNINQDDEDQCPQKRKKRSAARPISKSIFNPKSDEIAAMLREQESADIHSDSSVDSNKTVAYDCNSLSPYNKPRSFSPLPSTSKDNETFLKNDLRFNESLLGDNFTNDSSQSDVEIVELPCETIIVDDDAFKTHEGTQSTSCIEDLTKDVEEINYKLPSPPTFDAFEDDLYSSIVIDVDQTYSNDDCEIIDVDNIIAENKNIIDKYQKGSEVNTVTHVQPNMSRPQIINDSGNHTADTIVKESSNSQTNRDDSIEFIVTDFFRGKDSSSNRNSSVPTVDLTSNARKDLTAEINLPVFVKFLSKYLHKLLRQNQENREVVDTIDLDQSTHSTSDSGTYVSTTQPNSGNTNIQTSNVRSSPNNSVSLIDCAPSNVSSHKIKGKSKKTKPVDEPLAPPINNQSTPIRRIGDCPICMDNLSNTTIASTICGHIFCMPCIKSAIKASGKRCPTCRKALKGVGYHQLFL